MRVVVVAGTSSGVGKTSVAVGLMRALRNMELTVQAFKVGPDFLDPMHHEEATGRPSVNLDGWMLDKSQNIASFHRAMAGADVAVIEGVMGLFDGRDGRTEVGSTAQMAKWLGAPVLLVLDCWAMARSAAAMVKGYEDFDSDLLMGGVILNKVGGDAHCQWLREAFEAAGMQPPVLGGIPKDEKVALRERHLGLHRPCDRDVPGDHAARLGSLIERHLDLERLLQVAATAAVPPPPPPAPEAAVPAGPPVRIAVAKDAAFCFYYAENLQLLREAGAELVFFSPLADRFPPDVAGLYLGGGYPEMYAGALSERRDMRAAVKAMAEAGGVVYAECGGLLYLSQSIQPLQQMPASMVGVFPFRTHMTQGSMKMGYVEISTLGACALFPPGQAARGHVYHFSEILQERVVGSFSSSSGLPGGREGWEAGYRATLQTPGVAPVEEGFTWRNVLASYVHLHFGSNAGLAPALVQRCRQVDVAAVSRAAAEAAARAGAVEAAPVPRLVTAQSSPNLQGLYIRNGANGVLRARSVELPLEGPPPAASEAYKAKGNPLYTGTSCGTGGTGTPSYSSQASSPSRSPRKGSPFASSLALHSPPSQTTESADHLPGLTHRDGGPHASTSGREGGQLPGSSHSSRLSMGRLSHRASLETPHAPSEAIVSLIPSGTEVLFALGLEHRLIGVTDFCDWPPEARRRPVVSRTTVDTRAMSMAEVEAAMQEAKAARKPPFEVDAEFLARHAPGLVLTQDSCAVCDAPASIVQQALEQAGLLGEGSQTQLLQIDPRTLADVFESILQIGAAAGVHGEAVRLVDRLRGRLRACVGLVAPRPRRPKVLSLEGINPLCLGGLWLAEMRELAGGDDGMQQAGDPPRRISWDQVRAYEPEVLLLCPCSCNPSRTLAEVAHLAGLPGWWGLPAVRQGQVYIIDHTFFSRPGPRVVDGVELLSRILHPDAVSQRCPEGSVLKLSLRGGQRCRQRLLQNYFLPFQ